MADAAEKYAEMGAAELREEVERRGIVLAEGSGSGKGGRVVMADMIEALVDDDAKNGEEVEVVAKAETKVETKQPAATPAVGAGEPKLRDIVHYIDKFSRQEHEARVSFLHGGGVVNLQVFTGKGVTRPVEKVHRGTSGGCWKPRAA